MTAAAETVEHMTLSAKFIVADEEPLTGVELLEGCELHEGAVLRAKIARSENGGSSRIRVRPVIKTVGDASGVELADQLHAIAWNDCKKLGRPQRYLAELEVPDEAQPVRIYFTLSPDVPVVIDNTDTKAPSLEYVRGLEQLVLLLSTNASRVAVRQGMNEEKRINLAWAGLDRLTHQEIVKGQVAVQQTEADGRNRRRDKVFDGVISLLPKLADKFLAEGTAGAITGIVEGTPMERIEKLVTADQFKKLEEALGPETWKALGETQIVPEARTVLALMSLETQKAMLDAIGRDHIMTIAGWK